MWGWLLKIGLFLSSLLPAIKVLVDWIHKAISFTIQSLLAFTVGSRIFISALFIASCIAIIAGFNALVSFGLSQVASYTISQSSSLQSLADSFGFIDAVIDLSFLFDGLIFFFATRTAILFVDKSRFVVRRFSWLYTKISSAWKT